MTELRKQTTVAGVIRRRPVEAFFALAILLSWSYWIPDAVMGGTWTHFPGLVGPAAAATAVTAVTAGSDGLRRFVAQVCRWRAGLRWYAASLIPLAVAAVVIAVQAGVSSAPSVREISNMRGVPEISWFGVAAVVLVVNGFGEEIGWRGFAWPAMRTRHMLGGGAIRLAVPWAIWHIPLFWINSGMRGFSLLFFPVFFISIAAGAVVLGWLYDRSGSVLVVALWHTALNMASATEGTQAAGAAVSVAVIVLAIGILRREHAQRNRSVIGAVHDSANMEGRSHTLSARQ